MEQKVKEIISRYVKLPAEQIQPDTVIDRSVMASSILLHRMYATLASAGIIVENYGDITTFGVLMQRLGVNPLQPISGTASIAQSSTLQEAESILTGIDVEQINLLPSTTDYREHEFYTMNFSPSEIAYCVLQPNPIASFAGLFAAKEAIVKADNSFLNISFNTIIIDHLPGGKPVHPQFSLSISHTEDTAVAVALRLPLVQAPLLNPVSQLPNMALLHFVAFSALLLSVVAIVMLLFFKS